MTVGWAPTDRAWRSDGRVAPADYLRLAPTSGIACWQFTDLTTSLTDLINGIVLTDSGPSAATLETYGPLGPAPAIHFNGNTRLQTSNTLLRLLGDLSIELIMRFHEPQGEVGDGSAVLCAWEGGTGDADLTTNLIYQLRTSSAGHIYSLNWDSEHGSGVNDNYSTVDGLPLGQPFYCAVTRINDVVRVYRNAFLIATSGTLTTPTGGNAATGRFCLGGNLDGFYAHSTLFSARISNVGISLSAIQAAYTATLGQHWAVTF